MHREGDDAEGHPIATAKVAHVHTARRLRGSGITRRLIPRELRTDRVAPSPSGESSWSLFRESETELVSESRGGRLP